MLKESQVLMGLACSSKEEVFSEISRLALNNQIVDDPGALIEGLIGREAIGTTKLMDGFAIPHCKHKAIKQPAVFYIHLKHPIAWDDSENKDIQFLFSMAIPEDDVCDQLKLLGQLSRKLIHTEFRDKIKYSVSPEELVSVVNEAIC